MTNSKEKLFSEFAPTTTEAWKEKAVADLKGADYEKKLVWKTNEGFAVQPFYRQEDIASLATTTALPGEYPFVRGNKKDNNEWLVRQDIDVCDFAEANAKALHAVERGATSLGFKIKGKMLSAEGIETLLAGIRACCVELNFSTCQGKCAELADILIAYYTAKGYDLEVLRGSINYDPMSKLIGKGKEIGEYADTMKTLVEKMQALPKYKCVAVNALALNNAGSYISQELGYALAWGNEYLGAMVEAGVAVDVAAKKMKFNFGISSNYFMEIAKFRAARMLWATIVKQYEPQCDCACKMTAHAETSTFNMTLFDAHVNMLRTQTEAMSAAIAGVHSLEVKPFNSAYACGDEFAERIARNVQLLLKNESHFDNVVDPAGGSYFIENLTASIAEEAWKLFLEVENEGGYILSYEKGTIAARVNASAEKKNKEVATRRTILLGTNQYPNFGETLGADVKAYTFDNTCSEAKYPALKPYRGGEAFEAMRQAVDLSGKAPKAFMLTCGSLAMARARAQFSCNFFACAGIKVQDNTFFASVEEGVKAAKEAKADIVVVCSSDDDYATLAPEVAKLIGDEAIVVVAGAPACAEELKAQGISHFISVRDNVLETLKGYLKELGI